MSRRLFELAGADPDRRFSPFCWRARMALKHKDLPFETEPVRFTEKDKIAFSDQERVPVLVDGETVVSDSWAIADYLDREYDEAPALFDSPMSRAEAHFLNCWADRSLHPAILPLVILDIFARIDEKDRDYFRESREAALGQTLEDFAGDPAAARKRLDAVLAPLQAALKSQDYICGEAPAYGDYILFGSFQWARCVGFTDAAGDDSPLGLWFGRMLDSFGGEGRDAVCG